MQHLGQAIVLTVLKVAQGGSGLEKKRAPRRVNARLLPIFWTSLRPKQNKVSEMKYEHLGR